MTTWDRREYDRQRYEEHKAEILARLRARRADPEYRRQENINRKRRRLAQALQQKGMDQYVR